MCFGPVGTGTVPEGQDWCQGNKGDGESHFLCQVGPGTDPKGKMEVMAIGVMQSRIFWDGSAQEQIQKGKIGDRAMGVIRSGIFWAGSAQEQIQKGKICVRAIGKMKSRVGWPRNISQRSAQEQTHKGKIDVTLSRQ